MVIVPLLALLAVVGMSLALQLQERQVRADATRANMLATAAQNALVAALNGETGVRGFAATGNETFLDPYNQELRHLPVTLAALDRAAMAQHQQAVGQQLTNGLVAGDTFDTPNVGPWLHSQPTNGTHYRIEVPLTGANNGAGVVQVYTYNGSSSIGGTGTMSDCGNSLVK